MRAALKFVAGTTGLEPAVSCVTGRRVRPLHYVPANCIRKKSPPSFNSGNDTKFQIALSIKKLINFQSRAPPKLNG